MELRNRKSSRRGKGQSMNIKKRWENRVKRNVKRKMKSRIIVN